MQRREIRFGHSPDPDDAFMYFPLSEGLVDTEGIRFVQVLEGIESLNRRALKAELETTAASVHACAYLAEHECAHDRNRPGAAGIEVTCLRPRVRAVSKLAGAAVPPAIDPIVGGPAAGVVLARVHLVELVPARHGDRL